MTDLTKRRLAIVSGIIVIAGAVLLMRYLSEQKPDAPRQATPPRARQVETMTAQNGTVDASLEVQGQLAAFDKIELFSEVTGQAQQTGRPFKVGSYFPKGSVLVRIDNSEARLSLQAQKSTLLNGIAQLMPDLKIDYPESFPRWEAYLNQFNVDQPLRALPEPASDREKLFVAARNLYTQYYNIKSAEERLSKYNIYAPFSGVLTEATIQPGAIVRASQKLGSLMATGNYELVATVPLSELDYIKVGNKVRLESDDVTGSWTGTIRRISDQIDPGSQTVRVYVGVSGENLREGMYLRGEVDARKIGDALQIPRELLVDQGGVFLVNDTILRLQPVDVVKINRETAVVRGVPEGSVLLRTPIPNAFDGMKVRVQPTVPSDTTGNANARQPATQEATTSVAKG